MPRSFLYNRKGNVKSLLFLTGIILIISGLWYSQRLVDILEEKATEYLRFRIKVFENNINNPNFNTNIDFLFSDVIQGADYPIIYTDTNRRPQSWINISPELDQKPASQFTREDSLKLEKMLSQMAAQNEPIPITYQDSIVLGYYYYGFSPVINKLRMFPYIAIGAAALFILIGYLGFSYIKKSEQGFIWVGMAKETAHQLGTPLSAIAGWLELLEMDPNMREQAIEEIRNDLKRLNKIANRFSKIGSSAELKPISLNRVVHSVVDYFQRRLPQMQKKITIRVRESGDFTVRLNADLFEWVMENLIKNSIDAIDAAQGEIKIHLHSSKDGRFAYLDISDNGRGIASKDKKNIFKPGFSTKKRGWGLGLNLARRIVHEYHGGKLILKETRPGSGTTFRIMLRNMSGEKDDRQNAGSI